MNIEQEVICLVFFLMAIFIFFFPLIISLITGNYWLFFLFFVSWIPAIIIAKIGVICSG